MVGASALSVNRTLLPWSMPLGFTTEQSFWDSSVAAASKTTCTGPSFLGSTTPATADWPVMWTVEPPHTTSRPLTVMLFMASSRSPRPLARIRLPSKTASWIFASPRTSTVSR